MKVKEKKINSNDIEIINKIINDAYNDKNIFNRQINKFYTNNILNDHNKIIFLYNDNDIIGMLIYKIYKFNDYNILTIEELCIINKYKSQGLSKIIYNYLFEKIKNKYSNCFLVSIVCDLRSVSNQLEEYEIIYPNPYKNNDKYKTIIEKSIKIIKKWYMIELDNKNSIYYIPFYNNIESYNIFNSKDYKLNKKQKIFKKILKNKKYCLGFGVGIINIIKIT